MGNDMVKVLNMLIMVMFLYDGEWKYGKKDGYGVGFITYSFEYTGEWKNGLPNGEGSGTLTKKLPNGWHQNIISGSDWIDGKYNGVGTILYSVERDVQNYIRYAGSIKHTNIKNGFGELYNIKNNNTEELLYAGEWRNNKYHGSGTQYASYFSYTGEFNNGKYDGSGTYSEHAQARNKKYVCTWKNGSPISGELYVDENLIYKGKMRHWNFNGYGTSYYENGNIKEDGYFDFGKLVNGISYTIDGEQTTVQIKN